MHIEWWADLRLRVRALLNRRRLNHDLEEEIRFHLAERTNRYAQQGLESAQAARLARQRFGSPTAWKEVCRNMWTFRWTEVLLQDLRYALRTLWKNPSFTITVTLTLALGIGANTAIFSVFDATVLRPLPYQEPSKLIMLWGNVQRETVERRGTSLPDYADWRDQSQSFDDMALFRSASFTVSGVGQPERFRGEFVAHPYFRLLGVRPIVGRTFRPEEDTVPQRDAVVILSAGLWQRKFGRDPGIVGQVIRLNDRSYTVIGVLPEWFQGITDQAELWIPLHMLGTEQTFQRRGNRGPSVLARLKADISLAQAQAEMDGICKRLEQAYPDTNEGRGVELSPLDHELLGDIRRPLAVLLASVGLVLLIVCTNVANLLLVRSETRQREVGVRTALGAGRGRILVQLMVESGLLALLGTVGGLLFARWGVQALMAASPITLPSFIQPDVDLRVMLFAMALTAGAGILLGVAPAAQLRSVRLHDVFKQSSRSSTAGRRGRGFRNALVVSEVALATLLLIGAGLLVRSLQQLTEIRLGYDPSDLLAMRVSLPRLQPAADSADSTPIGQADARTVASVQEILRHVGNVPAVEAVAAGSDTPLTGRSAIFYSAEGQPPMTAQDMPRAYVHGVTSDFFLTLRIPFIAGRTFTERESQGDSNVVIVSENVVRRFWPGDNPIGKRIRAGREGSGAPWLTIVGVVNEMKYRGLPSNPTEDPDLFLPFSERQRNFALLVRTSNGASSMETSVRRALHEADPALVAYATSTLDRLVSRQTAGRRFTGWLMGIFAVSALLLAMIGIYGVSSYTVARRTQEIGIRIALGAERSNVLRLVTGDLLGLVAGGLAVGLVAALALTRLIESLLYGIKPSDPQTFIAAGLSLLGVAVLASLVPALRATRIRPAVTLRDE